MVAGGVGGARFLRGLTAAVPADEVVAIVNVGDDLTLHGLRICPDLDSITYWLGGVVHPEQQWGRADERSTVSEELRRFGTEAWFTLGDRDLATHLHRTSRLATGAPLSVVTDEIRRAFGVEVRLLPATDDPLETRIRTRDGRDLHFQEYWVRERAEPRVAEVVFAGAAAAEPAPGVVEALLDADAVLLAPSNPVVSVGPVLAVPAVAAALRATTAPVIGVSPVIGGRVVRGMADRLLPTVGAEVSAAGVAAHYGTLLDGWVVDTRDADAVASVSATGVRCVACPTLMDDVEVAAALARTCLELAEEVGR
ncbi:2-phospho-L-lactate transferase [Egicoccus halophilus]|uniref:2-phospho-L-lactate transferase n=1 Tax=Egicoccus halophilus TaxID=1670830 RepID=A0A8J3A5S8_9ACTN|nr:2-phospho-L-lactate transferase [Egicoccus halophilus]